MTAPGADPTMLDAYPYLCQQWTGVCNDAARLWREIRTPGYRGGYSRVPDYTGSNVSRS